MQAEKWQRKIREMIPSYGRTLGDDAQLCKEVREYTSRVLGLKFPEVSYA